MRVLTFATLTIAALGAGTVAAPVVVPAQAAEKPQHCVVDVSTASRQPNCHDTFTTAIAKATKGRVTNAPADVRTAMRDPKLVAELNDTSFAPTAGVVLSIEYVDSGFSGDSVVFTAPTGCTPALDDIDWQVPSLGPGLDDEISSYRAFSNCFVKHWEHPNYTGLSIGFDGGRSDLGEMDDKTSSIQWS